MVTGQTYTFAATLYSHAGDWLPEAGWQSYYRISFYDVTGSRELAAITQANFDPSALGYLKSLPATFKYTATSADNGDTLRLIMNPDTGSLSYAYQFLATGVDGVTVTVAPEPSTLMLLGTALFGLLAYAWRKRK